MYLTKLTVRGGLQMMIPIISLFPSGTKARLNGCFKNELGFFFPDSAWRQIKLQIILVNFIKKMGKSEQQ